MTQDILSPAFDDETASRHLHSEINAALKSGGAIAAVLGVLNGVLLLIVNTLHLVEDVSIPCIFAFVAGAYSWVIYRLARSGAIRGATIYTLFLPFVCLPTAFFLACHLFLPGGAASYITGPFSYLYFFLVILTGFVFDFRLSCLAGVLAGAGYMAIYLLSSGRLAQLPVTDPLLMQDLSSPLIYGIKSLLMVFGGFLVGGLSFIARRLIFRVLREEQEKSFIRNAFGMIIDPRVRDQMIHGKIELGGEERVVTALFADIRGFTTFSQRLQPRELFHFMKEYFDLMNGVIREEEGTIMEYVGDEVMVLFGAPLAAEDHAVRACSAGVRMQQALAFKRTEWEAEGKPQVRIGIGIHTGPMLVGIIGSSDRYKYGAIGDNVNLASRLQGLTKEYGVEIIASGDTVSRLGDRFVARELGRVTVRGRTCEEAVYEIAALKE